MVLLRALLFPFSILYDLVTRIRNHLYDIGYKRSFRFETMVISVGNLNVGGSGKTPMVEYLIQSLSPAYRLATLSRGYGRKTTGFRIAASADSASTLGDEPYQIYSKFGKDVRVAVGEDRVFAIPHILQVEPPPDIIVLDDAFQHRQVDPQLSILLTDYRSLFYNDCLMPSGSLRESRRGAKRSDAVVVTKCPSDLSGPDRDTIRNSIHGYAPSVPVFFTSLLYGAPTPFATAGTPGTRVILVSGIANAGPFEEYAALHFTVLRHFKFRDHHRYTDTELKAIHEFQGNAGADVMILTTEKDRARLFSPGLLAALDIDTWFYLPVRVSFLENGSEFDSMVLQSIAKNN